MSRTFLDAGILIGAVAEGDPRFAEAHPIVEAARVGDFPACTSVGVLSEVYAALTWAGAQPPCRPEAAAAALARLVEPPSAIEVLSDGLDAALLHLRLAAARQLTARRIHDARHATTAIQHGVTDVFTYDPDDWTDFVPDGLRITGPPSIIAPAQGALP